MYYIKRGPCVVVGGRVGRYISLLALLSRNLNLFLAPTPTERSRNEQISLNRFLFATKLVSSALPTPDQY